MARQRHSSPRHVFDGLQTAATSGNHPPARSLLPDISRRQSLNHLYKYSESVLPQHIIRSAFSGLCGLE